MDPVADFLTSIRNANKALNREVVVRHSNLKESIARILKQEGFIADYAVSGEAKKELKVNLKIKARKGVIEGIKRVSKPPPPGMRGPTKIPSLPKAQRQNCLAVNLDDAVLGDQDMIVLQAWFH